MNGNIATAHEPLIRLGAFIFIFLAMALWETLWPRRQQAFTRRARWPHNIGLLLVDVAVLRIFAPSTAIAVQLASDRDSDLDRDQVCSGRRDRCAGHRSAGVRV